MTHHTKDEIHLRDSRPRRMWFLVVVSSSVLCRSSATVHMVYICREDNNDSGFVDCLA